MTPILIAIFTDIALIAWVIAIPMLFGETHTE